MWVSQVGANLHQRQQLNLASKKLHGPTLPCLAVGKPTLSQAAMQLAACMRRLAVQQVCVGSETSIKEIESARLKKVPESSFLSNPFIRQTSELHDFLPAAKL